MHPNSNPKDTWWVGSYITKSNIFPCCAPKNVELIGSLIGGSADLEIGVLDSSFISKPVGNKITINRNVNQLSKILAKQLFK